MHQKKIFIPIVLLGIFLLLRFFFFYQQRIVYHTNQHIEYSTLLLSDIDSYKNNITFTTLLPNSFPPERVRVIVPSKLQLHYGQSIQISGNLKNGLPSQRSVAWTISLPIIRHRSWYGDMLFNQLYAMRKQIESVYYMSLSDVDSSLLLGIVFGIQGNMPRSFSQDLQKTGVTHVIAASGMNVTMVAGFLIAFFKKVTKRKTAIFLSILGLILYAFFAGLQPSILRATLMGMCVFSAQLFGRQYHSLYILLFVGCIMLFISPELLFSIGFQLSFLSTFGIITLQPLFSAKNIFTEDMITTISAQIATFPILLITFGQYSLLSILVNTLVLWIIPFLMILGSLGAIAGMCIPFLGKGILFLAIPFLWYFEYCISFFASLPSLLVVSNLSYLLLIGYYCIFIAVIVYLYQRRVML